jgi:hypothetical protein
MLSEPHSSESSKRLDDEPMSGPCQGCDVDGNAALAAAEPGSKSAPVDCEFASALLAEVTKVSAPCGGNVPRARA